MGVNVIPQDSSGFTAPITGWMFTGTNYAASSVLGDEAGLPNNTLIQRQRGLCYEVTAAAPVAGSFHYYHVLIPR
jgi:hypothetical protein